MCSSSDDRIWLELELNWRIVMATIIGFLGSAFGTVGGFGGDDIFVPMLTLIVGFDAKSAAALSKYSLFVNWRSKIWKYVERVINFDYGFVDRNPQAPSF
ncbi:unnamed protein product [Lactuca virosa]|uniref:Sulfite exporter TauE/SafE family protein n=1 Tax=Lactuca virosa TaxID=75947 RepID=A0AAU9N507_9ASTR|nr:unnamed protein product [Lactuca virosa]